MIESISVNNFKSIHSLKNLELKPLTLFVGTNSSGNSIVQFEINMTMSEDFVKSFLALKMLNNIDSTKKKFIDTFGDDVFGETQLKTVGYRYEYRFSDRSNWHYALINHKQLVKTSNERGSNPT